MQGSDVFAIRVLCINILTYDVCVVHVNRIDRWGGGGGDRGPDRGGDRDRGGGGGGDRWGGGGGGGNRDAPPRDGPRSDRPGGGGDSGGWRSERAEPAGER